MTVVEFVTVAFHGSVMFLGGTVLFYTRKLYRLQLRALEADLERKRKQAEEPHLQRIVDAANDWYDDKRDSKERLRAVIAQSRGIEPFKLIQRP